MQATRRLSTIRAAYMDWCLLWPDVRRAIENGAVLEVEVRPEKRSLEQNALLHSLIGEIADTVEWAGKKRDAETWKRLLVAAWLRARGFALEVLPALDGKGIDVVYAPTSKLTKGELSELVEFVQCWAAEHGVDAVQE